MKYHIERKTTINADSAKIVPLISDFKNWKQWPPWSVIEADENTTGPASCTCKDPDANTILFDQYV